MTPVHPHPAAAQPVGGRNACAAVRRPGADAGDALIDTVRRVVAACDCRGPAHVAVLRTFGQSSRQRSRQVRRSLAALHDTTTHDEPVPVVVNDRPLSHVCSYVDAAGVPEARRVAALARTPLVRCHDGPEAAEDVARTPLLRLRGDSEPFPSATGSVIDVAFAEVSIRPNQPEQGQLAIRTGTDTPWRYLPRGAGVAATVLPEAVLVRASGPGGFDTHWLTPRVAIKRIDGLFPVTRDDLCVSDLEDILDIRHDPAGLVEFLIHAPARTPAD